MKMSVASKRNSVGSNSTSKLVKSRDSLLSKKSRCSGSFISQHGSKFGRSVAKFPKQNDPSLVQSAAVVNSRVIRTTINFPINVSSKLPDLTHMEATDCIREVGSFLNILDYEFNYASFWLLDILSKLIKHMQLKGFSVYNQNVCLTWIRFVLRYISVSGAPREEIFVLLQSMFLEAEKSVRGGKPIPQPEEINNKDRISTKLASANVGSLLSSESLQSIFSRHSRKTLSQKSSKASSRKSSLISNTSNRSNRSTKSSKSNSKLNTTEDKVKTNLEILGSIVEVIYKVFANRFMFSLISEAYSSPIIITPMDIPIEFKDPKQLRPTLVVTPPPSPKKSIKAKSEKKGKDKGKGKKRKSAPSKDETAADTELTNSAKSGKKGKTDKGKKKKSSSEDETGAESTIVSGKKGKAYKGKKKKSASEDETEAATKTGDEKKSKKGKNSEKDKSAKKGEDKDGKNKKKSKPSLSNQEEVNEPKKKSKDKGKGKGGKTQKKAKSSEGVEITHDKSGETDTKDETVESKALKKSASLKTAGINVNTLEEKLKLFEQPLSPEMKLEKKKIEVKDQFILPLSEGVSKDYVENLIKTILPPETKPTGDGRVRKEQDESKSRKSSSVKRKISKDVKANKKGKVKKKK